MEKIAEQLGFRRAADFEKWMSSVLPLAYGLQNIAPAEARNGPNPEYPWPHEAPTHCPAGYTFDLWNELRNTGRGRKLMTFINRAIGCFDAYA